MGNFRIGLNLYFYVYGSTSQIKNTKVGIQLRIPVKTNRNYILFFGT